MTTKITRLSQPETTMNSLGVGDKFSYRGYVLMKVTRFTRLGGADTNAVSLVNGEFLFVPLEAVITPHSQVEITLS